MVDSGKLLGRIWPGNSSRWFVFPERNAPSSSASRELNAHPSYRPDIDGLRALAILAVVSFHVFPDKIPGGFLGVDVFFVISGFLISTIIFKSLANNRFSFIEFYAHRIRRISPALILVVAFCLAVGRNALLPAEFRVLGKHVVASAGFFENFVLWREAGYFDISTALKPLMHVWSLSIEEQFYLIFPLLVVGVWRLRLSLLAFVVLTGAMSFATYLYVIQHDAVAAFFSPQTRYWELMTGAILAHLMLNRDTEGLTGVQSYGAQIKGAVLHKSPLRIVPNRLRRALLISSASVLGLALVALAMFGMNSHQVLLYPGAAAPLAVLGAAMLIFSGQSAWVNRALLSNRLVVFIGLVSYPLYLWHWPLLSYLTIVEGKYPEPYQRVLCMLLAFVLAVLTFQFVEQPIRRNRKNKGRIAGALVVGMSGLMLLGISSKYLSRTYDQQTAKILQSWTFADYPPPDDVHLDKKYRFSVVGHNDQNRILFIGDSHSRQYRNTAAAVLKRDAANKELPEVTFLESASWGGAIAPPYLDDIASDKTVSAVVLSNFWALRYRSDKVNYAIRCCGEGLMQTVGKTPAPITLEQMAASDAELENMVKSLIGAGKRVYVILDNPFGAELAPRSLVRRSLFHGIKIAVGTPLSKKAALERAEPIRSRVQDIAQKAGAEVIDPIEYLCAQGICPILSDDGTPTYLDYDHLSLEALLHDVRYLDFIGRPTATP